MQQTMGLSEWASWDALPARTLTRLAAAEEVIMGPTTPHWVVVPADDGWVVQTFHYNVWYPVGAERAEIEAYRELDVTDGIAVRLVVPFVAPAIVPLTDSIELSLHRQCRCDPADPRYIVGRDSVVLWHRHGVDPADAVVDTFRHLLPRWFRRPDWAVDWEEWATWPETAWDRVGRMVVWVRRDYADAATRTRVQR